MLFKFRNSGFIFGAKTGWEVGILDCSGIRRYRKWLVLDAGDGKFPNFSGQNPVLEKQEMKTLKLLYSFCVLKKILISRMSLLSLRPQ